MSGRVGRIARHNTSTQCSMLRALKLRTRIPPRAPTARTLSTAAKIEGDGWIFGHVLNGNGGSTPLPSWDVETIRQARRDYGKKNHGVWAHIDFRAPQAQGYIAGCAGLRVRSQAYYEGRRQRADVSTMMTADPRTTQPRCEVDSQARGMLLTLQVNFGKRLDAHALTSEYQHRNIVPFRMWLGRGILITARGRLPHEGAMRLPALSNSLEEGDGPHTCGALASAVISEITSITAETALNLEDEMFALTAQLQQQALLAGSHRPVGAQELQAIRAELAPLRYAAVAMRRYEVPELSALQAVVRLTERPEQTLFSSDADTYELREAAARQEALVESLNATIEAGEALQEEVAQHAAWQQSAYSFQLTVLGCVLSVLGFCSISIDAYDLWKNAWAEEARLIAKFVGRPVGADANEHPSTVDKEAQEKPTEQPVQRRRRWLWTR